MIFHIAVNRKHSQALSKALDARFTKHIQDLYITFRLNGVNEYLYSIAIDTRQGDYIRAFIEGYVARIDHEERQVK